MDYETSICWVLYGIAAIFALGIGTGKLPKSKSKMYVPTGVPPKKPPHPPTRPKE